MKNLTARRTQQIHFGIERMKKPFHKPDKSDDILEENQYELAVSFVG